MIIRIGRDRVFHSFEGNVTDLVRPVDSYPGKTIEEVLPRAPAVHIADAVDKAFATGRGGLCAQRV